jgi:hypothetical protein
MKKRKLKLALGKNVPLGIKIISLLYYVAAAIFALTSLTFIVLAIIALASNADLVSSLQTLPYFTTSCSNVGVTILVTGIFIALFAVLEFFIGKGLPRAKLWTKILVIIFSGVSLVAGVVSLVSGNLSGIINLVFSALVGGYLLFSKEAKLFFTR